MTVKSVSGRNEKVTMLTSSSTTNIRINGPLPSLCNCIFILFNLHRNSVAGMLNRCAHLRVRVGKCCPTFFQSLLDIFQERTHPKTPGSDKGSSQAPPLPHVQRKKSPP